MEKGYLTALHECLPLDDTGRREYVAGIPTAKLRRWSTERGKPSSWCETLRDIIMAELATRE